MLRLSVAALIARPVLWKAMCLVGLLATLAGCRPTVPSGAGGVAPGGGASGGGGFEAEERLLLEAMRHNIGRDLEVVKWGPHRRFREEDLLGGHPLYRPGDCVLRVVYRANFGSKGWIRFDALFAVVGGVVLRDEEATEYGLLKGLPNVFGDDWLNPK